MAVGREAIGGAAIAREPALMHGGGGQGLRPMHCATDIWEKTAYFITSENYFQVHHRSFNFIAIPVLDKFVELKFFTKGLFTPCHFMHFLQIGQLSILLKLVYLHLAT